jgi:hypothetical protein
VHFPNCDRGGAAGRRHIVTKRPLHKPVEIAESRRCSHRRLNFIDLLGPPDVSDQYLEKTPFSARAPPNLIRTSAHHSVTTNHVSSGSKSVLRANCQRRTTYAEAPAEEREPRRREPRRARFHAAGSQVASLTPRSLVTPATLILGAKAPIGPGWANDSAKTRSASVR